VIKLKILYGKIVLSIIVKCWNIICTRAKNSLVEIIRYLVNKDFLYILNLETLTDIKYLILSFYNFLCVVDV